MNNKQNNQTRNALDSSRQNVGSQYQDFLGNARTNLNKSYGDADNLRNEIFDRYSSNDAFMPKGPNGSGWFDLPDSGASGGGRVGADYSAAKSGYQNFADTGGINRADFEPAFASYKGIMSNGGIGEGEAQALRARATSMVPSFYNKYKQSLQRRSNVQGGYSPGFDAQMSEIGRQAGREGFQASRQVEGDIADKRQQGRMFGTSGYGSLMSDVTGKEQSGKLAGLGGLKGIGDSEMSASSANAGLDEAKASRNMQAQLAMMGMYQSGRAGQTRGLQDLYSSAPGNVGQASSNFLSGLGGLSANDLNNLSQRGSIQDRSWMDMIPGLIGAGGGILSGMGGGIPNMRSGGIRKPSNSQPSRYGDYP
jgi:hypothetical protein